MHRFASTSLHTELLSVADFLLANVRNVLCYSSNLCLLVTLPRLHNYDILQRLNSLSASLRGSLSGRAAGSYTTPRVRELLHLWRFLGTQPSILWEISGVYERLTKRHCCKVPSARDKVCPASPLFVRCHIKLCIKVTVHRRAEC
jgi:hypothetical protein